MNNQVFLLSSIQKAVHIEDDEISYYTFAHLSLKMLIFLLTLLHTYRWRCWDLFLHFCTIVVQDIDLFLHFCTIIGEDVDISSYTSAHLSLKMLRYLLTLLHNCRPRYWSLLFFCTIIVEDVEISSYTSAHLSLKMLRYLSYIFWKGWKKSCKDILKFLFFKEKDDFTLGSTICIFFYTLYKNLSLAVSKRQSSRTFAQNDISYSSVSIQRYGSIF